MTLASKFFTSWSHQKSGELYSLICEPYVNFAAIWYTESDSSSNIQLKQVHIIFSYLDKLRLRVKTQFFYFLNAFASLMSIPRLFRAFFKAGNMYRDGLHVDKLQPQVFHDGNPVCTDRLLLIPISSYRELSERIVLRLREGQFQKLILCVGLKKFSFFSSRAKR